MATVESRFHVVDQTGVVEVSAPTGTILTDFRTNAMEMTVFNVGAGEAILLRLHDTCILVDGGARVSKRNTALGHALRNYLVSRGVRLMAIVASHPHVDHLNAIETILSGDVSQVLAPGAVFYHNGEAMGTFLNETLLALLDTLGPSIIQRVAIQGLAQYPGPGGTTMSMFVNGRWKPSPAYKSIFTSVSYGEARFLLTGDVYTSYEDTLLADTVTASYLATTVLKITHHGSQGVPEYISYSELRRAFR